MRRWQAEIEQLTAEMVAVPAAAWVALRRGD